MRKLMSAVVMVGLCASVAYAADPVAQNEKRDRDVEFRCRFDGASLIGKGKEVSSGDQCWVRGKIEGREAVIKNDDHRRDDRIEVRCASGFELRERDAAVEVNDETLWVNADRDHKIVTLRVRDFDRHGRDRDRTKQANLVVSDDGVFVQRLIGECRFDRDDEHGHDNVPLF